MGDGDTTETINSGTYIIGDEIIGSIPPGLSGNLRIQ